VLVALAATGCGQGGSPPSHVLFLSDRDGDWALYTMGPNGGNEHRAFPAGQVDPFGETLGFGEPVVSPDGRAVIVARRGLVVVTLATGASRRVGAGEESTAAWSPDGKAIVFSGRENEGLYLVDARGGPSRQLLPRWQVWTPTWSPDGTWIACAIQIGYGPIEVYALHPDGSGLRRLSRYAPAGDGRLAWSRDGRLAFVGTRESDRPAHLVLVDVRAHRVEVLRPNIEGGAVSWSPDGRTIAYAATSDSSRASAIYTVNSDGSGRRRLTPSLRRDYDKTPVWSPDGGSLLFVRERLEGGAERGVPQVWTMRADGSHQHPLTTAFPDGGDNLEPAWINGPVRAERARSAYEVHRGRATVLHLPFAVDGISAEGDRAAIAPVGYQMQRDLTPTPPILLWRPGRGEPTRLVASPCGGVQQLLLVPGRLAFDCNDVFFEQIKQSLWVFDLRTRMPRDVFFGRGGVSANDVRGVYLGNLVGGGNLIVFGSDRVNARGVVLQRTLWRVDRFDRVALPNGSETGTVVAAGAGRLAVELGDGRIALITAHGLRVRILTPNDRPRTLATLFGVEPKPPFLLAGRDLLLLGAGATLQAYETATGKLRRRWLVSRRARLEAGDGRLIVYVVGRTIHLLSGGRDKIVRTDAQLPPRLRGDVQQLVHAALTADGLYFCFNVPDRRYPGRAVFVPRGAL
jgi:hypothetical protein